MPEIRQTALSVLISGEEIRHSMSCKEIIKVPMGSSIGGAASLPGFEPPQGELVLPDFEEHWTGGYIFENEWQSFRTHQNRDLELTPLSIPMIDPAATPWRSR